MTVQVRYASRHKNDESPVLEGVERSLRSYVLLFIALYAVFIEEIGTTEDYKPLDSSDSNSTNTSKIESKYSQCKGGVVENHKNLSKIFGNCSMIVGNLIFRGVSRAQMRGVDTAFLNIKAITGALIFEQNIGFRDISILRNLVVIDASSSDALYRPGLVPRDYQLLSTLSNALQEKACNDEDDLDCWLSNFFEPMPV
ncbi:hypothetical protein Y032_0045g1204 [Ancylostoma ceylanicum]|uniref:Receptor L-domain domain-containing protein n=1 Tax=Ancylostoma ceylanicum TaxID=53326 RepID=A0A016UEG8_9BILA|nr:hypothetical protein Y032_0045g1204 [Ancylostoma ceylanicum]